MPVDLDTGALKFWALESDPFSGNPLMFDNYADYPMMVKTSTISSMNDLSQQLLKDTNSKRIILKGNRGTGKTTAMRYLYKNLAENHSFKAIYCNISDLDEISVEAVRFSIHSTILRAIIQNLKNDEHISGNLDFEPSLDAIGLSNITLVDGFIMESIRLIHKYYSKLFLFIDNIDKPAPERYSTFQDYFSTSQGFYEETISSGPTYLFLPMQPFMIAKLEMSKQTEYLADKVVEVRNWSFDELDELLEKRLRSVCTYPEDFSISKFFDQDVRLVLYTVNDFVPRWVIKGSRKILQKAYDVSKENGKMLCKPIKKDFANRFKDSMKGAVGFPEFKKFDIINDIIIREHFRAYDTIKDCLRQNEALVFEIVEGLLAIWERQKYYDDKIKAILSGKGIISLKRKEKSREDDKYDVEPIFKNLIDRLYDAFYNDVDSIRYYLITSNM